MRRFISIMSVFAIAVILLFIRIVILIKIYTLTLIPLGAPPALNWIQMFGIALFIGSATLSGRYEDKRSTGKVLRESISSVVILLFNWLVAWWIFG